MLEVLDRRSGICTPNACVRSTNSLRWAHADWCSLGLPMNPLPARDPRRVVTYIRTSSAEQGKAFGPESQRRAIKAYADHEGLEIVAEHTEDASGTLPLDDRPG